MPQTPAPQDLQSPVTGGPCEVLDMIAPSHIVELYKTHLNYDPSRSFGSLDAILRMKCSETGYEFYHPDSVAGDGEFYEELYGRQASENWAYQQDKWELQVARRMIPDTARSLLDVGSGGGDFLKSIADQVPDCAGLEMNRYGIGLHEERGLKVFAEDIATHAGSYAGHYDVVTAFQVLEHVYEVRSFLDSCLAVLKPGGLFIIAVPNNDGFVGAQPDLPLNMPPHHVGLWRRTSLEKTAAFFDLSVRAVEYEPLQQNNTDWYLAYASGRYFHGSALLKKAFYRLGFDRMLKAFIEENRHTIHGHTILICLEKQHLGTI